MKKELLPSILLTIVCAIFFCGVYPLIVWGVARFSKGAGEGVTIQSKGQTYFLNIGQKFNEDKYFWSRPSAVDYKADGAGGSNKGPSNPEYLAIVEQRIDTFIMHNPGVNRSDIPSDLVTASGSGLDPDISIQAANVQVKRIALARNISENSVRELINKDIQRPLYGLFGTEKINVLKLNTDLDNLKLSVNTKDKR